MVVVKKIRVLHCIHSLSAGGAEKQLTLLADESARHGIETAIFCVSDKGNDIRDPTVQIYRSKKANKYNFSIFGSLNAAIERFNPDILHAWLPASVTIPTMLLALLKRLPCVFSYRNAMVFGRPLAVSEYILAFLGASHVITNNSINQSNAAYRLLYRIKRGVLIRNAVHVDALYQKPPSIKNLTEPCKVLFVGRITAQKNLACLLRAIPYTNPIHEVQLHICGDGEDKAKIVALTNELNLSARILHWGYRQDVYLVMQSCDILVLPSWYEGMPNVLLEALYIGLPCVLSDIPAHRDIIGDTGAALMFDPANPRQLAVNLDRLAGNRELAHELAERGRRVALSYFPERMAREYYNLYSMMVAKAQVTI